MGRFVQDRQRWEGEKGCQVQLCCDQGHRHGYSCMGCCPGVHQNPRRCQLNTQLYFEINFLLNTLIRKRLFKTSGKECACVFVLRVRLLVKSLCIVI
jgi:hypothetical protein